MPVEPSRHLKELFLIQVLYGKGTWLTRLTVGIACLTVSILIEILDNLKRLDPPFRAKLAIAMVVSAHAHRTDMAFFLIIWRQLFD